MKYAKHIAGEGDVGGIATVVLRRPWDAVVLWKPGVAVVLLMVCEFDPFELYVSLVLCISSFIEYLNIPYLENRYTRYDYIL